MSSDIGSTRIEADGALRKTKLAYANEGAEKAKHEAEGVARKRKVEDQAKWEGELLYPPSHFVSPSFGTLGEILRCEQIPQATSGGDSPRSCVFGNKR